MHIASVHEIRSFDNKIKSMLYLMELSVDKLLESPRVRPVRLRVKQVK